MIRFTYVLLAVSSLAILAAGVSAIYAFVETNEERRALVQFVCAAIEVAQEQRTPEALRRAERFTEILDSIGESCPPKGASP